MTDLGATVQRGALAIERRLAGTSTHVVEVDGLPITYDQTRPGAPVTVVMLHGFSADRDVWVRFAARLGGYRVVVPDLAGHGATPFVTGAGYSAADQAQRVLGLMDALGIERAHVIGNSMGGFITATLAATAPDRVLSAGLVDAAGVLPPSPSDADAMVALGHNPFLLDDVAGFDDFYAMTMARPPFVPGLVRRSIGAEYVRRRDQLAEIFADFHHVGLLDDRLDEITAPTWIAWGALDRLVHVSTADVWQGIAGSRLTVYPDLGHMPMMESPRRSASDYAQFLRSIGA